VAALQRILDRLKATRGYRAWTRYGEANGDLLAAGVGYFAFFSIFPALALAFAIFGFVLQGRPDLVQTIAESLNSTLPGMVKTPSNPDGIISVQAPASLTLTVTGIVSFVTLLLAGLGWVGALRTGIRGVFGLEASTDSMVRTKARDLFVLVTLGLAIALSAILTLLKLFGGFLVSHASGNPVLGAVAVAVGLLFWLNLMARVILLSAAWAANDVDLDHLGDDTQRSPLARALRPAFIAPLRAPADTSLVPYAATPVARVAVPSQRDEPRSRATDRVSVAAGAVVGAAAALAVTAARRLRRR